MSVSGASGRLLQVSQHALVRTGQNLDGEVIKHNGYREEKTLNCDVVTSFSWPLGEIPRIKKEIILAEEPQLPS